MSESNTVARDRTSVPDEAPADSRDQRLEDEVEDKPATPPSQRRAWLVNQIGLWGAPIGIAALAGLLFLYYRSLGLDVG